MKHKNGTGHMKGGEYGKGTGHMKGGGLGETGKKNTSKATKGKNPKDTVKDIGSFPTKNCVQAGTMEIPAGVADNALGSAGQEQHAALNKATLKGRHYDINSPANSI